MKLRFATTFFLENYFEKYRNLVLLISTFYEKSYLSNSKLGLFTWNVLRGYYLKWFQKLICRLTIDTSYEKNYFEASRPVLDMIFDVYDLHGILDSSRCRMLHLQWRDRRSFWSNCHRISWWPNGWTVSAKIVNLCRVFFSTPSQTQGVVLGP